MAIGQRNAEFAKEWLDREGIKLAASDFGGAWSRKVLFTPTTGDAFCRRMPTNQDAVSKVVEEEQKYQESLIRPTAVKRVELF